ncbi:MAG: energy transducer TonB, partial [Terriglobia bacterium]
MPPTKLDTGSDARVNPDERKDSAGPQFLPQTLEETSLLSSLWLQIRERKGRAGTTALQERNRVETRLPVSEMGSLFQSLRDTVRSLFEEPSAPAIPITSRPVEVGDLWQDYKPQWYSGVNSLLIILILLGMVIMPSLIHAPVIAPKQILTPIQISPYLAQLPPSPKKAGGGGGGGNRSPTPASKGAAPKFAWRQLAPPVAKVDIPKPELPVTPTLLGPPQLKLPQVAMSVWGNPTAVPAPPSNGPGANGGIGTGANGGVGSGNGAGLGPGSGAGTGGGAFSVGGNVSEPVAIYDPEPQYSERAREAKYQGTDVLSIIVQADGSVTDVQVVRPLGLG